MVVEPAVPISVGPCRFSGLPVPRRARPRLPAVPDAVRARTPSTNWRWSGPVTRSRAGSASTAPGWSRCARSTSTTPVTRSSSWSSGSPTPTPPAEPGVRARGPRPAGVGVADPGADPRTVRPAPGRAAGRRRGRGLRPHPGADRGRPVHGGGLAAEDLPAAVRDAGHRRRPDGGAVRRQTSTRTTPWSSTSPTAGCCRAPGCRRSPIHAFTLAERPGQPDDRASSASCCATSRTRRDVEGWFDHVRALIDLGVAVGDDKDEADQARRCRPSRPGADLGMDVVLRDLGWDLGDTRDLPEPVVPRDAEAHGVRGGPARGRGARLRQRGQRRALPRVQRRHLDLPRRRRNRSARPRHPDTPGVPAEGQPNGGGLRVPPAAVAHRRQRAGAALAARRDQPVHQGRHVRAQRVGHASPTSPATGTATGVRPRPAAAVPGHGQGLQHRRPARSTAASPGRWTTSPTGCSASSCRYCPVGTLRAARHQAAGGRRDVARPARAERPAAGDAAARLVPAAPRRRARSRCAATAARSAAAGRSSGAPRRRGSAPTSACRSARR